MRSMLESLTRISRVQNDQLAAISVAELLADLEQLHRSELLQRSIEFQLNIAPALPRVLCSAHQLRQAVLHCLQYSIAAIENQGPASIPEGPKTIRMEATRFWWLTRGRGSSIPSARSIRLHPHRLAARRWGWG